MLELGNISSTAFGIFFDRVCIAEGISTGGSLVISSVVSSIYGTHCDILISSVRVLVSSWSTIASTARGTFYRQYSPSYHRRGER